METNAMRSKPWIAEAKSKLFYTNGFPRTDAVWPQDYHAVGWFSSVDLQTVFMGTQHGEDSLVEAFPDCPWAKFRGRSMCAGDVVVVQHFEVYRCEPLGWKLIGSSLPTTGK